MAEELGSTLGFDVSEAVASLKQIKRAFDEYSSNLEKAAGDSAKFNKEQAQVDNLLKRVSTSAQLAAAQLKGFASAQKEAARASETFIKAQRDQLKFFTTASKAQQAGEGKRGPLSSFVDQNRAQRQRQASDLRNQLREQEQALRNAFRGPPPVPPIAAGLAGEAGKARNTIQELGVSWKGLLRIFATQIAFQALGSFIGQINDATAAAIDFELQLARIGTISEEFAARGLDATADTIDALSARFGTPIEEAAAGLYNILSDQIESAAEATEVFSVANEFAAATGASAADSASLLTGIINAYGLSAGNAREISDQLFVTIDRGRVSAENIANTFGRIAPLAAQLGIDLFEVNAALAELTIQGVKESDAITQLTNVMLKLIKPTDALQVEFDKLGVGSAEAGIAIFGFDGFLRKVTADAGDSASEIGELFNQIRGTRGVIGIISRDAEEFEQTLQAIKKASEGVGATAEASARVLGTPAATVKKELTDLRNFLVDDIGRGIVSFAALASEVISAKSAFQLFASVVIPLGVVFGAGGLIVLVGQFGLALKTLSVEFGLVSASAATARGSLIAFGTTAAIVLAPVAVIGMIVAFNRLTDQIGAAREATLEFEQSSRALADIQIEANESVIASRQSAVRESIRDTANEFRLREVAYTKDKAEALRAQEDITADFKAQLEERSSALTSFLSQLRDVQKDSLQNVKKINQEQLDVDFSVNAARFERDFQKISDTPAKASTALIQRSQQVVRAAQDALRKGNVDFAQDLFKEALDLANRAADVAGKRASGEGQVNRVLNEQRLVNQELIRQEQEKARAAAQAEKETRNVARRTVQQISRINEINEEIEKQQLAPGKKVDQDRLRALGIEREKLTQEVDTALSEIGNKIRSSPALKFLEPLAADLTRAFVNPLNNAVGSLTQTTTDSFNTVLSTLQRQANATPIELRVQFTALTGEKLGAGGFGEGLTAFAALNKELQQGIGKEQNIPLLASGVDTATTAVRNLSAALKNTADESQNFNSILFQSQTTTDAFKASIDSLQERGIAAAVSGDIAALTAVQQQLQAAIGTIQEPRGFFQKTSELITGEPVAKTKENLQAISDAITNLAVAQAQLNAARQDSQRVQNLEQAVVAQDPDAQLLLQTQARLRSENLTTLRELGRLPETQTEAIRQTEQVNSTYSEQAIRDERQKTIDLFAQPLPGPTNAAGATTQGQALGGLVHYFKRGGFSPRGTDTVPAMLSPGEFVVNSKSARRFYSELVAINAGVRPVYRAEGGPIGSTTNVGDIVINVPQGQNVNGRTLAKELRRELRRQTSKI